MGSVYIFRGKAATGKTTLSDMLSARLSIPVFRKDDIFDVMTLLGYDIGVRNDVSYKVLKKTIQTNITNGADFIIDIALLHTPYYTEFISSLDWNNTRTVKFNCVCTDDAVWRSRINDRAKNPLPSQVFTSAEQAATHYAGCDTTVLPDEVVIDSMQNINNNFLTVLKYAYVFK